MPKPVHLPSLTLGSPVQDAFLILDVRVRTLDTGDPYTILVLGNSTGQLPTEPFWPVRQTEIAGLRKGHVVQVVGEVGVFRDRRQLKIVSLRQLPPDSVDVLALLPSIGPTSRYWEALDGWRRELGKPRLKAVIDLFYDDEEFRRRYQQCPAAVYGHHAAIGGLLKHTTEVAAIGRTIARACGADPDLVMAGALLHDIGKLESYRWDGIFDHTEPGRLLGHVVLGALALDRRLGPSPSPHCTEAERHILLHLILSHHGRLEWGSPIAPMTLEAEVLHWADNASAKTATVAEALRNPENFPEGPVSAALRGLDWRRLFRDGSAWGAENDQPGSLEPGETE